MADYNVNMKQWNGTSFDNVLPLAYDSKLLNGKTYTDIQNWVNSGKLVYESKSYVGTGTAGKKHENVITFAFKPSILFFPNQTKMNDYIYSGMIAINTSWIDTKYDTTAFLTPSIDSSIGIYIKKSYNGRTFSWYAASRTGSASKPQYQMNESGVTYYCSAIGKYET